MHDRALHTAVKNRVADDEPEEGGSGERSTTAHDVLRRVCISKQCRQFEKLRSAFDRQPINSEPTVQARLAESDFFVRT